VAPSSVRHVELAYRSTLCFLARTLPGQRNQRRETIVAESPKGQNRAGHLFRMAAFSLHQCRCLSLSTASRQHPSSSHLCRSNCCWRLRKASSALLMVVVGTLNCLVQVVHPPIQGVLEIHWTILRLRRGIAPPGKSGSHGCGALFDTVHSVRAPRYMSPTKRG
jgi:hypothetical protein